MRNEIGTAALLDWDAAFRYRFLHCGILPIEGT